jgi:heme exporter protein CcmD
MSDSLADFWNMGGYARYVWPAYSVALGAIALTSWSALRVLRNTLGEARRAARDAQDNV